ncbi:MAG: hypothetical protein QXS00_08015 [Pyrobaculum sp.]
MKVKKMELEEYEPMYLSTPPCTLSHPPPSPRGEDVTVEFCK